MTTTEGVRELLRIVENLKRGRITVRPARNKRKQSAPAEHDEPIKKEEAASLNHYESRETREYRSSESEPHREKVSDLRSRGRK